jgi:hypothetical protein
MVGWKYSKERLKKHPFVAKVLRAKKVICVCGATIKLSRKWDEDYINRHARSNGCRRVEGQKTIYHFFDTKKHEINDSDEEWEDWSSEVEDAMDDDDIISVDEYEGEENTSFIIDITGDENVNFTSNKRRACNGLCSASISKYIERTPAKFGGSRRIEVIAKEIWPNKFKKGFSRKRLNTKEKRILNRQIYAESTWFIDRESKIILFF